MQGFRHIRAWQRACALSVDVHGASRTFGKLGHGNLRTQLTRAIDSIASNIVEGCGAATNKEFARYLDISIKSANEAEHHLLSARSHGLISPDLCARYVGETVEVRKMIYGYRKKVLQNEAIRAQSQP